MKSTLHSYGTDPPLLWRGVGGEAWTVDKIFQPFFTTKPAGQGTGLGLSLSYDIVTNGQGGELLVDTNQGSGTIFTIKLPV